MEFHPLANIFPLMEGTEFDEFCHDIAKNGLHEPILTWQGQIIDGRNRYRACMQVGINPDYREWNGQGDLLGMILSMNLHRRHLNETQRGIVANNLANMPLGGDGSNQYISKSANLRNSISQAEAAKITKYKWHDQAINYANR